MIIAGTCFTCWFPIPSVFKHGLLCELDMAVLMRMMK